MKSINQRRLKTLVSGNATTIEAVDEGVDVEDLDGAWPQQRRLSIIIIILHDKGGE